jgi:hypothetical protein
MNKKKLILKNTLGLVMVLLLATSCGSKGNDNENGKPGGDTTSTLKPNTLNAKDCNISFLKTDSPTEIAIKGNRARLECKLTEDEMVALIKS